MAPTDRFVSETTFRVRYAETDAMGIVHHRNYLMYFEEGRSEYARKRGHPYSDFERDGFYLMVSEAQLRYSQPAIFEQEITVRSWVEVLKSRRITFGYEVVDAETDTVLVTGTTDHICVTKAGKVARIPDTWRTWVTD